MDAPAFIAFILRWGFGKVSMIADNVREYPKRAFTLIELLVALMITSLVLTVVLTLAFAMTTAVDSSDDIAEKQARVRHVTLTISELLKHCKLVCGRPDNDLAIWKSDDDDNGKINITELVYIETGSKGNYIQLLDFPNVPKWLPTWLKYPDLINIKSPWFKTILKWYFQERYVVLVEQCSNAQFYLDLETPKTQFVSLSFVLQENGAAHPYQINASLRTHAAYLLDSADHIVAADDD